MASFFSRGIVPEPFFWGQNYLFPLESWLAAPLVVFGLRSDIAILFPAAFLTLIVFTLAIRQAASKARFYVFFCVTPFVLMSSNDAITLFLPRNFTTVSAYAALISLTLIRSRKNKTDLYGSFIFGLCVGILEPIIVFAPLLVQFENRPGGNLRRGLAMVVGVATMKYVSLFYLINPEFVLYQNKSKSLTFSRFVESLENDKLVSTVAVAIVPSLFLYLTLIYKFYSNRESRLVRFFIFSALFEVAVVISMLASNKIGDYVGSPHYSPFRFFIPFTFLPPLQVIYAIQTQKLQSTFKQNNKTANDPKIRNKLVFAISAPLLISVVIYSFRFVDLFKTTDSRVLVNTPTTIINRSKLQDACKQLRDQVDPLNEYISVNYVDEEYNGFPWMYGCRSISGVFVVGRSGDRRSWIVQWLDNANYDRVDIEGLEVPQESVVP